ncbi:MAG: hypothetical protein J0I06_11675 [Planctomycetes bacterium]|nr:hypothetical protein [Planctomycetota bacterium]
MTRLLPLVLFAAVGTAAAERRADPQTVMVTTGKVLLDAPLNAALGKDWKVGKGKWEAADGAVRGAELKDDMHGAVARHDLAVKDAVIAFSFKLDGAKTISLSLNGAKGHISRVRINPKGVSVVKDDQDGKSGPDTAAVLDTATVDIKPGEWHSLVVELRGPDILATLDGKHTAFGTHDAIAKDKANFGLTVAGETASFKGLKVYEAIGTTKDWSATREKLLAERKK